MNTAHFRIELRTDKQKKNGAFTLQMYAYINGVKKYYSLRQYISNPKHWNPDKQEVSVKCDNWHLINNTIQVYLTKARNFVLTANVEGIKINISEFDRLRRRDSTEGDDITKFIENYIKNFGNRLKPATIASYEVQIRKLNRFRSKTAFTDLSPFFWTQYQSYMISLGNNQNTIEKAFRILKVFIHLAIDHGIIKENPLVKVKVKRVNGHMDYLSLEELSVLEKLYKGILTKYEKNVLRSFLFACYTGLRYQDIKEIQGIHIFENSRIEKEMQKNGRKVTIELSDRAKALLSEIEIKTMPLFRVYANQPINRALKVLASKAGIQKKVTFHVSRHTFATITLSLSNDIAAVQKLCGHAKIQTTQIYAKVLDKQTKMAIDKWNTA